MSGEKFDARLAGQAENHFRRGHGVRIDPVHVGEGPSADVVVDADEKAVFQSREAGAVNAVALQNDGGLVISRRPCWTERPDPRTEASGRCAARHRAARHRPACPWHAATGSRPERSRWRRHRGGRARSAGSGRAARFAGVLPATCRLCFSVARERFGVGAGVLLATRFSSWRAQQFFDTRSRSRTVEAEKQFRRPAQLQALDQLMPDIRLGRVQPFQAELGFFVVAVDIRPSTCAERPSSASIRCSR